MAEKTEKIELFPAADEYFKSVPELEYPQALVNEHPRIANAIFELRDDHDKLKSYFDSLLNDSRGGRRGFSFPVMKDIQNLRELLLPAEPGLFWV